MTTFLAPASRCLVAASRLVNRPVDSTTTSTPRSFHGSSAGSRTARPLKPLPSTTISSSVEDTEYGRRPRIESYLSRWASVALSVMSLTATISISVLPACLCASTARQKLRPIRPNPLTPTRTVTPCLLARKYLVVPHPSVRIPTRHGQPRNRSTARSVSPPPVSALPRRRGATMLYATHPPSAPLRGDATALPFHERSRIRAAALHARRLYPGRVGELV